MKKRTLWRVDGNHQCRCFVRQIGVIYMDDENIIERMCQASEHLMELWSLPPQMENYDDGMCAWIKPQKGTNGAEYVYRMDFGNKSSDEIRSLIQSFLEMGAPKYWLVTPSTNPQSVHDILIDMGLMRPKTDDFGLSMAMLPDQIIHNHFKRDIEKIKTPVKRINSKDDFLFWCEINNKELCGYEQFTADVYYPLCESGEMACFLAYYDDIPVAASAAITYNGTYSLEFVSTLHHYRRKGMGTAVSIAAMDYLVNNGADLLIVGASPMGVPLYKRLGFKAYYKVYF